MLRTQHVVKSLREEGVVSKYRARGRRPRPTLRQNGDKTIDEKMTVDDYSTYYLSALLYFMIDDNGRPMPLSLISFIGISINRSTARRSEVELAS
jgi:hypothetical protein